MKKKINWSRIISLVVILGSVAAVLYIVFSSQELPAIWEALSTLNPWYLTLGILTYAGFVLGESAGLFAFLRMEGYRVSLLTATHFSFTGLFYANITPSSTGGQPMQVYLMTQRKIPGGVATSALTARYFFNQVTVVLIAAVSWICCSDFVSQQLSGVWGLAALGLTINALAIPLVILVTINRRMVEKVALWGIRVLTRMRLCKRPEHWQERSLATLGMFHDSLFNLVRHPGHLLFQFFASLFQNLSLFTAPLLVYWALGGEETAWYHLLTISSLLFVSASYTPLPGASGAQEGGFLAYFQGMFPEGTISVALLLWRFMTYYSSLLAGAVHQLLSAMKRRHTPIETERTNA